MAKLITEFKSRAAVLFWLSFLGSLMSIGVLRAYSVVLGIALLAVLLPTAVVAYRVLPRAQNPTLQQASEVQISFVFAHWRVVLAVWLTLGVVSALLFKFRVGF